jgi:hypothetical protein
LLSSSVCCSSGLSPRLGAMFAACEDVQAKVQKCCRLPLSHSHFHMQQALTSCGAEIERSNPCATFLPTCYLQSSMLCIDDSSGTPHPSPSTKRANPNPISGDNGGLQSPLRDINTNTTLRLVRSHSRRSPQRADSRPSTPFGFPQTTRRSA